MCPEFPVESFRATGEKGTLMRFAGLRFVILPHPVCIDWQIGEEGRHSWVPQEHSTHPIIKRCPRAHIELLPHLLWAGFVKHYLWGPQGPTTEFLSTNPV